MKNLKEIKKLLLNLLNDLEYEGDLFYKYYGDIEIFIDLIDDLKKEIEK